MAAPKGNKFALGLTTNGRPPIYKTPEELEIKINDYFESLYDKDSGEFYERATITGLSLYLGFDSRKSFYNYGEKKDFLHIIKRAQQVVEMSYENMLGSKAAGGAIFALKNMGWKDRTEQEISKRWRRGRFDEYITLCSC